jgi:histidine ammonia-lyase
MMIPEYVSAALTNAIWGAAMPSHLFSLSTDAGQEDHVSMSATLVTRVLDTIPRLSEILAIELAFGSQAAAIRQVQPTIPSKQMSECSVRVNALIDELQSEIRKSVQSERFEPLVQIHLQYKVSEQERSLSPVCEQLISVIRKTFPPITVDRELSSLIKALAVEVDSGALLRTVEKRYWQTNA